jgi:hypothetical protein
MPYATAVKSLPQNVGERVASLLKDMDVLSSGAMDVAGNLQADVHLPDDRFTSLLVSWASASGTSADWETSLRQACRPHKCAGPGVKGASPRLLGRAEECGKLHRRVGGHAARSGSLSRFTDEETARGLNLSSLGQPLSRPLEKQLRDAPTLPLVWATFNGPQRDQCPWDGRFGSAAGVRTAFGLGTDSPATAYYLLRWPVLPGHPPLTIPTVADASVNPYWRTADAAV